MKKCRNCGQEVDEEAKFCPKCGSAFDDTQDDYEDEAYDYGLEYEEYKEPDGKNGSNKTKFKIAVSIFVAILVLIAGAVGILKYKEFSENSKREIQLLSVDAAEYPSMKIEIKASNYNNKLNKDNLSVKENDVYPKDVDLKSDEQEEDKYIISYTSTEKDSGGNVDINIAYTEDGKEVSLQTSYDAPDNSKDQKEYKGKANGDNSVNTYDDNEILVKNAIDKYEKAFIQMIDYKDTYYIKSAVDLSGGLVSEFEKTVNSYKEQDINETLRKYNVENITKVSEGKYDVTVYEEYHIYYGKEHKNKNEDFRTRYLVNKCGSEFKVYSIKNIEKI